MSLKIAKKILRKEIKSKIASLTALDKQSQSSDVAQQLFGEKYFLVDKYFCDTIHISALSDYKAAKTVAIYLRFVSRYFYTVHRQLYI